MSADVEQEPRHRWSRLVLLLPLAVFGLLAAAFYWGLWNNDDRLSSTLIGKQVPEFALSPIEGRQDGLSSADLHGQVSLVNVWASWCVPCRTENPLLVELAEAGTVPIYGDQLQGRSRRGAGFPRRARRSVVSEETSLSGAGRVHRLPS